MEVDPKFVASFDESCYRIADEYMEITYRYIRYGLHPGGMFTSIFANDVLMAACRSHPLNDWNDLQGLMKWMVHNAPRACYGSYDDVEEWCKLPQQKRDDILLERGLIRNLFEVIKDA